MFRRAVIDMTQQATKQMPCRRCGDLMTVGIRTVNQPRHVECGVQDSLDAIRQMKAKSGPHYERWRMGMLLAAERVARGTHPLVGDPRGSDES